MYQCQEEECQAVFERPNKEISDTGRKDICPNCGFDEVEKISICQQCGEPATYKEMYCESCKNHIEAEVIHSANFLTGIEGFDKKEVWKIITGMVEREG